MLKAPGIPHLVSANKLPMTNLGIVHLNLYIAGLSIQYQFCVLRELSYHCILGVDWLYDVKGQINFADGVLSVYDNLLSVPLIRNVDRASLLLLSKPITIPPLTECLVPVMSDRKFNNIVSLVEAFRPIQSRLLAVAASAVIPRGATTMCRIVNLGDFPKRLRAKTAIATITPLDVNDPFNSELRGEVLSPRAPMCATISDEAVPSHDVRLKLLTERGLSLSPSTLTTEQFEKLSYLLYQNAELFITEMDQLPGSDLVEHKI